MPKAWHPTPVLLPGKSHLLPEPKQAFCEVFKIVFLIQDMSTVFGRMTKWQAVAADHVLV